MNQDYSLYHRHKTHMLGHKESDEKALFCALSLQH